MAFRFTIGRKIGLGFGSFIILTMVAFVLTVFTLVDSKQQIETVVGQVTPSIAELKELNLLLQRSHTNASKWFYNRSFNDIAFRDELKNIIRIEYPKKKALLLAFASNWSVTEKKQLNLIFNTIENLFNVYENEIIEKLVTTESYSDANIIMPARLSYEDSEENIKVIYNNLTTLIALKQASAEEVKNNMLNSFNFLNNFVKWLGITLVVGGLLIALYTTRSITKPIKVLKKMLIAMGQGILPTERIYARNDEVGEMGIALNELIRSMDQTTEFAKKTGAGQFDASYKPLSKADNLGHALLKMRDDLAENERSLERKVIERTEEIVRQKSVIENKNTELENLYKQVTDSIHYAKRIQEAILPPNTVIQQLLPNSFILFKPKDIVSGDFYWIEQKNNLIYFAAVDCTGHGVPGAFMSIVGHTILKDIINNTNISKPSEILDELREGVINTLHASNTNSKSKDGMDITLCCINFDTLELQYAAAYNPLYLVRNGEMTVYPANKFPIGAFTGEKEKFTNTTLQLQKDDQLFIFSDGYADQFGGPNGKKFMIGNFRKLLSRIAPMNFNEQLSFLNTTLANWQGNTEQVDDILVIGLKI